MSGRRCLVCGGALRPSTLPGLLACTSCGFTTADVTLSPSEIERLYSGHYFSGGEYRDYLSERALTERHFRARLERLLKYVKAPGTMRLFEIGSAYGFFLSVAAGHFESIAGIDISRDAATHAADVLKLPVQHGDFLECD